MDENETEETHAVDIGQARDLVIELAVTLLGEEGTRAFLFRVGAERTPGGREVGAEFARVLRILAEESE